MSNVEVKEKKAEVKEVKTTLPNIPEDSTTDEENMTQKRVEMLYRLELFLDRNSSMKDIDIVVDIMNEMVAERNYLMSQLKSTTQMVKVLSERVEDLEEFNQELEKKLNPTEEKE